MTPRVSVVMIVKNEADCLAACLDSVKDADEIVVMDTGSTDGTVALLEARQVVLRNGLWKDDFAAARNEALEAATGDWILSIDADEVLQPGGMALIRAAITTSTFDGVKVTLRGQRTANTHSVVRLFRRGVRWVGAIHETPDCVAGADCGAVIEYGSSPAHALDPDRSLRILERVNAEAPDHARTLYYLAREHWYRKNYGPAVRLFSKCVQKSRFGAERADAFLLMARCLWAMSRGDEARAACMNAITINANFREALCLMAEMSFPANAAAWKRFAVQATNEGVLFARGLACCRPAGVCFQSIPAADVQAMLGAPSPSARPVRRLAGISR